ncbi:MAG: hypothetical protein RIS92_32 [Verrucomicrobiota bacterium]
MAGGCSEEVFLVGAVQVDVAGFRVGVFGIDAVQPEDACLNVIRGVFGGSDSSGGFATDENFAGGRVVAVFLADDEASGGGAVAAGAFTESEL